MKKNKNLLSWNCQTSVGIINVIFSFGSVIFNEQI